MNKLSAFNLATIVKYRGLGFSQAEIADKLDVTPQAISYQLKQIKKQAQAFGIDKAFNIHCEWLKNPLNEKVG